MSNTIVTPQELGTDNAHISVNQTILNGGGVQDIRDNQFKTNANLLQKDEWEEIDDTVYDIARNKLVAVNDLIDNNLVQNLGGLGTLVSQYEKNTDMSDADINMSPLTGSEEDTTGFELINVPVPIVQKDFTLDIRRLRASRNRGDSLDTIQAQIASRKVSEASEDMVYNGLSFNLNGNSIYGYTNHPDRNTGSADGDFSTITNIYPTVQAMVNDANNDGYDGPFMLYVASDQYSEMRQVYTDGSGDSALQRVQDQFPEINDVKKAHYLDDGELVLVQMTQDVVDLAVAEEIQTIEWNAYAGMKAFYKVMAAWVPRVKSDAEGKSGVVHYTGA